MSLGNAIASFVGGAGKGYFDQTEREKDRAAQDEDRAWRREQRELQRRLQAEADAERAAVRNAAAPVAVQEGMNKPEWADNRDVGSPEMKALPNAGLEPTGTFTAAGQSYTDRAAAEAAAAAANAPDAVAGRVANAYRSTGNVDKAMALEGNQRNAQIQTMQLADAKWKRDLGMAMRGGHDGLAALATNSEAGPMAGLSVKAVPSADGKTVTYAAVDKDGKAAPIPGLPAFSNDQNGLIQAAWMLDQTITPEQRMQHFTLQQERDRQQGNTDRQFNQQADQFNRSFGLQERGAARQDQLADLQIKTGELAYNEAKDGAKVPAAVKMQIDGYRKEADTIGAAIAKAQADGSWQAGSDNSKALLSRQAVLTEKINAALSPYIKRGESADPFGLKGKPGGGAGRGTSGANTAVMDAALKAEGVDGKLAQFVRSIYQQESSSGGNTATSNAGAVGGMQILPDTFKGVADKGWDINNAEHNARGGVRYAKEAWAASGGDPKLAAAYYYGGPKGMEKAQRGVAVSDPRNPKAPNTLQYGDQVAARMNAAPADPMEAVYKKQVAEMNRGLRDTLSPDVAAWRQRTDDMAHKDKQQQFSAAQAAYLQAEKARADKKSRELVAASK